MDKDQIKAVLEAVNEALRGLPLDDDPADQEPENEAHHGSVEWNRPKKSKDKCVVPKLALFVIFAKCVTINNGACPDWEFCDDKKIIKKL